MGSGTFNTTTYYKTAATYKEQNKESLFQKKIFSDFNPLKTVLRESCASKEHPDPTSIIIACDVTGSMGKIPESLLKGGLGKIMESLLKIKSISNPQVMFAAIGDMEHDKAPLQITQFESDNRIELQLKNLYLEAGGGGNKTESYHCIWYYAAYKTQLDSLKKNKKGLLFTMGDEMVPAILKAEHIRKFIDANYKGSDVSTSQLINEVTKKYDVFHLIVQDTSTYSNIGATAMDACWKQYLEERAILVADHTKIPEKIISTIQNLCELNAQIVKLTDVKLETVETTKEIPITEKISAKKIGVFSNRANVAAGPSETLTKDNDNIPNLFICPISQSIMEDPVVAEDGYTYERASITNWFDHKLTSPTTNLPIGKSLVNNFGLKSEIKQWQDDQAHVSKLTK